VLEEVNGLKAQGEVIPPDSVGQAALMLRVINELIDNEVVVQVAKGYKSDATDEDVAKNVDDRFADIRKRFKSETEFREPSSRTASAHRDYRGRFVSRPSATNCSRWATTRSVRTGGSLRPCR